MKSILFFIMCFTLFACTSSSINEQRNLIPFQMAGNKIIVSGEGVAETQQESKGHALTNIMNHLSLYCGAGIVVNSSLSSSSRANRDKHQTQVSSVITVDSIMRLEGVQYLHRETVETHNSQYRTVAILKIPKVSFRKECDRIVAQQESLDIKQHQLSQKKIDLAEKNIELEAQRLNSKLQRVKSSQVKKTSTKSYYLTFDGRTHPEIIRQEACQQAHNLAVISLSETVNGEQVRSEKLIPEYTGQVAKIESKGHVQYTAREPQVRKTKEGILCTATLVQSLF